MPMLKSSPGVRPVSGRPGPVALSPVRVAVPRNGLKRRVAPRSEAEGRPLAANRAAAAHQRPDLGGLVRPWSSPRAGPVGSLRPRDASMNGHAQRLCSIAETLRAVLQLGVCRLPKCYPRSDRVAFHTAAGGQLGIDAAEVGDNLLHDPAVTSRVLEDVDLEPVMDLAETDEHSSPNGTTATFGPLRRVKAQPRCRFKPRPTATERREARTTLP